MKGVDLKKKHDYCMGKNNYVSEKAEKSYQIFSPTYQFAKKNENRPPPLICISIHSFT